ncbi:MAG: LysR family transcriptional regulator [Thermoguttaceae bacterium]|jgi:molybdate transport repressor ModE-like protein|nr:LysR family transcriptional regulator [Thermoguttaceae bacterium]
MAERSAHAPFARLPEARVKVWLELDGHYVFGHGLSEILKAVEASGSIKEGAARLGKSYRYVWGRIKKAESRLGRALVRTRVGGKGADRSALTPLARRLVGDYDALRQRMFDVARQEFDRRFRVPSPAPTTKPPTAS